MKIVLVLPEQVLEKKRKVDMPDQPVVPTRCNVRWCMGSLMTQEELWGFDSGTLGVKAKGGSLRTMRSLL